MCPSFRSFLRGGGPLAGVRITSLQTAGAAEQSCIPTLKWGVTPVRNSKGSNVGAGAQDNWKNFCGSFYSFASRHKNQELHQYEFPDGRMFEQALRRGETSDFYVRMPKSCKNTPTSSFWASRVSALTFERLENRSGVTLDFL